MSEITQQTPQLVPAETSASVEPKVEKYQVKVNGKTVEVTLDELTSGYGLNKAADEKFQKAAQMRKEAEEIKNIFSAKDITALRKAGWTDDEIVAKSADFIVEDAKRKSMTPQQIKIIEDKEELDRLRKENSDKKLVEEKRIEDEKNARFVNEYQSKILSDMKEINKKTFLDMNDPIISEHVLKQIAIANSAGWDMPVAEAVRRLEEKLKNGKFNYKPEQLKIMLKNSIKDLDDDDLEAFLTKGGRGVRERSIESLRKAEAPFARQKSQTQSTPASTPSQPKRDMKYFDEQLKKSRALRYNRVV